MREHFNITTKFSFQPVSVNDVEQVIKDIKSKKFVCGDILINILKECYFLFSVLADCINKYFENGAFPDCLKEANVTPIFKKDDPLDKENYRPVSILPLLSKVFEKLIYKQLSNYIEFFEFYTLWFSKHAEYPTCFIQVTSFLAKRVSKKRICGYNFNGFVESI